MDRRSRSVAPARVNCGYPPEIDLDLDVSLTPQPPFLSAMVYEMLEWIYFMLEQIRIRKNVQYWIEVGRNLASILKRRVCHSVFYAYEFGRLRLLSLENCQIQLGHMVTAKELIHLLNIEHPQPLHR
jgi:hypothetical protein